MPLSRDRIQHLASLTEGLDTAGLWWLSGYAAGLAGRLVHASEASPDARAAAEPETAARLTILYGSQTGNCRRVAESLAAQAGANSLVARLVRADVYRVRELAQETLLYVVISTQGDGDPPDDSRGFLDFLAGRRAPKLDSLAYAVLGLGDSSYPQFCVTGRNLDARLAELGATRLFAFAEADLDFEGIAESWNANALESAREILESSAAVLADNVTLLRPRPEAAAWSASRPFQAEVIAQQRITSADSAKDVRHIEIDIAGAGLDYEPGDSLGVVARNPVPLVDAVLEALHLDGDADVAQAGVSHTLREWLTVRRELTRLSRPFLNAIVERSGSAVLRDLLRPEHADALRRLMETTQPIDLLLTHPGDWSGEQLVAALRPLAPRLYSIASSRAAVGDDEAHLTVCHVEYTTAAGTRWGAASHWLAERTEGDPLDVYLERNERFRLPADPARDVIMIGPGTGVAPFRAFLQQRIAAGAHGRNWLFFGNSHFRSDFLYQVEWQAALENGTLARMDVAFSRDPDLCAGDAPAARAKSYVQDRVRERGRDVFDWLENGAHVYVCGATAMARDVEDALCDVIAGHGARTPDAAAECLGELREQRRYARDVY